MNLYTSFRDSETAKQIIGKINRRAPVPINIMEFCGGHTVAIFRSGIRSVLPKHIHMLSGPGCPVCVTSNADLDKAIALAHQPGIILATYGDMLKVPGSRESLRDAKAQGCDIRLVYSPLDALSLAEQHPDREVVFFAVGFETTAPPTAAAIMSARSRALRNFSVCSVMKLTIPGAKALLNSGEARVDAIIGPGHVSTIIGADAWRFMPEEFGIPVVISGFEPLDLLASVDAILDMKECGECRLVNLYSRVVTPQGNRKAWGIVQHVFDFADTDWRGFGNIPASGLRLQDDYAEFDAERRFELEYESTGEHPLCRCGEVLRGLIDPVACDVFGTACTPEHPLGPCMVSSEGACAAWFLHGSVD